MATGSVIRVGELVQGGGNPIWLHTVGYHSALRQTKRWGYGDWALEFDFEPPRGRWPLPLAMGRIIEQWYGGRRIWSGTVENVDRESGRVTCAGLCRMGERVYALDGSGQATANPGVALLGATFGTKRLAWGSLQDYGTTGPYKQLPAATEPNKIGALFDAFAKLNGQRWYVDSNRAVWLQADPTTPTRFVSTSDRFGVSAETLVTHLKVDYDDGLGGRSTPWIEGPGAARASLQVEKLISLYDRGPMTEAEAIAQGRAALKLAGEQAALTGSVTVRKRQVVNAGGARVHPQAMVPGLIYRFQGHPDPRSNALYTDALIGETVWDEEEGTVQLTPMDAEREDLQATIEAIGGQLVAA